MHIIRIKTRMICEKLNSFYAYILFVITFIVLAAAALRGQEQAWVCYVYSLFFYLSCSTCIMNAGSTVGADAVRRCVRANARPIDDGGVTGGVTAP